MLRAVIDFILICIVVDLYHKLEKETIPFDDYLIVTLLQHTPPIAYW